MQGLDEESCGPKLPLILMELDSYGASKKGIMGFKGYFIVMLFFFSAVHRISTMHAWNWSKHFQQSNILKKVFLIKLI